MAHCTQHTTHNATHYTRCEEQASRSGGVPTRRPHSATLGCWSMCAGKFQTIILLNPQFLFSPRLAALLLFAHPVSLLSSSLCSPRLSALIASLLTPLLSLPLCSPCPSAHPSSIFSLPLFSLPLCFPCLSDLLASALSLPLCYRCLITLRGGLPTLPL
jgi:hypothetical protein